MDEATEGGKRRRRTVSITTTLVAATAGLVFLSVASVLIVSYSVGTRNTYGLVEDRLLLTMSALERRVRAHVDPSIGLVQDLAGMIAERSLATDGEIRAAMAGALAGAPPLMAVTYFDGEDLLAMGRFAGTIASVAPPGSAREILARVLADTRAEEPVQWGPIQYQPTIGDALINLRAPVQGADGEVRGIVVALIRTRGLSQALTSEADLYSRNAFLLYGPDRVVAHRSVTDGGLDRSLYDPLPRIADIGDPVLQRIGSGDEPFAEESERLRRFSPQLIHLNGESHIVLTRPIEDYTDRMLVLGTHVPLAVAGEEVMRLFMSGMVGVVLLVVAVIIAVFVGRRLARPVRRAAAEAVKISALDLKDVNPLPPSRITELDQQSQAFNSMLVGLHWLETYVPSRLVRRLMAKGGDERVHSVEREATVLFTDITGFTTMFEHRPAAETADFLNHHFGLVAREVEAEDGMIDKYIGDALMAVWSIPDRQPDHAARAGRAALAVGRALARDNAERAARGEPPIRVRIGLHTGRVVAGNIGAEGRMNYTIVGDAVNTAQRIEALARSLSRDGDPATILVSGETRARLGDAFSAEDLGEHALTGRQGAVRVFRLLGCAEEGAP